MIRLVLAIGIAAALWPVNDEDQPLGIGNADVALTDMMSAGYALAQDAAGFCGRNTETCQTISTLVIETTSSIQAQIFEASSKADLANDANPDTKDQQS